MQKELETLLRTEIDPGYAARSRFIFETIDRLKPAKILDAGCGRGFYTHALTYFPFIIDIQSFDIVDSYIEAAKTHCTDKRITIKKANIYKLPYKDNTFDAIILSEVLEHLDKEIEALQELKRVLKKGGTLIITVPHAHYPFLWDPLNWILEHVFHTHISKDIWWLAGIWADHERLYTADQLVKILKDAEFNVAKPKKVIHNSWPFSHFVLYGIGKNIVERLGAKQFDRFSFEDKPISRILSQFMKFPSTFDSKEKDQKTYVNLLVTVKKT